MDLQRFVDAQDAHGTYDDAVRELRAGRKTSHWMWFVFPQLAGLGRSETARHYALPDLEGARSYLAHPVLGPRLRKCANLVQADPVEVFGATDARKLRSSMTLFALAAPDEPMFRALLERCFDGQLDEETTRRL